VASRTVVCPVHVGRDREVLALQDSLEQVRDTARGRLTLIAGEAGVGKSRLVAEAGALAARAGLGRLDGQCTPDAAVPYGSFVIAIRRRTRTLDRAGLTALFDGSAALAAALLPEVVQEVGLPPTTPAAEDLFAAVWQLLARLARPEGGLLLVLEDLHWADQDSLRLLAYLARELDDLPVWVVGTYRSDELHRRHPLTALVADLGRARRYDEVHVSPLDREQVRLMLSAIFDGTEVGDEFSDAVLERTGGNPFFVEELAKVLVERGDIYHQDGDWERRDLGEITMPLSVRETLLDRARAMEPDSVAVLEVAAVAGSDLDVAVLTAATGVSPDRVEDAIREGLHLQVLVERREGPVAGYAFRHALSREAFADELVGPDRARAHRAVAEAVAHVHADDLDSVAAQLADHYAAAGDSAAALEFALRAARRAASAFAGDEADRRFDQALRIMPADADDRLALLLEASGDVEAPAVSRIRIAFAEEARRLAAARLDPVGEARALNVLENARWLDGDGAGSIAILREALALVHGHDDYYEAWVLRRLTRVLVLGDRADEAETMLPAAIELAEQSGNLAALSGMHGTRMMLQGFDTGFRESYAAAVATARAAHAPRAEFNVRTNAGYVCLWCGDFTQSRQSFDRAMALGEQISPTDRYSHAGFAWLLSLCGEYDAAESIARPLVEHPTVPTRVVALTALAEVAHRRGDGDAAELADQLWDLARGTGEAQRSVPALAARARQVLRAQGVDAALPVFQDAIDNTVNSNLQGSQWPFAPELARALGQEGRVSELAIWVADVRRVTEIDPNAHNLAASTLCTAYLLSARDDAPAARHAFDEAVAQFAALPCPAREVDALLGLADLDWRSGGADAGEGAAGRALGIARRIDAATLVDEASHAVERSHAQSVLATVLFTDIVGSTQLAATLGDHGWRDLLARHHTIVRRELARTRGREVDTAGDGFLVRFDTPAQAIRCACSVVEALDAAGIRVRAGLHTGECQESGGKLTGLTVHIASRVSQLASAGEVLVSGTVKDLVAGSGIGFVERGSHQLKGVPGEWLLFAVAPASLSS
jgi:class 3 adenylate cyclase